MVNSQLSLVFDRIADLLEIDGADRFRINSYRRVARTVGDHPTDIAELAAEGELISLPGIGKGTADRIQQYLDTGEIDVLSELESKLPPDLPGLLRIGGMGPKKVATVYRELGVGSLKDLKKAIGSGELANLSGFGPTSVGKIAEGITFLEKSGRLIPLGVGESIAEMMAELVRGLPGVERVEIAGSIRRGTETVDDVHIICVASDGKRIIERFVDFDGVERVLAAGETEGSVIVRADHYKELQVDLRVVPAESFGAALWYFTGSKEHNVRLEKIAFRKGLGLSEHGLHGGERRIAGRSEEEVYAKLGLPWIPPEQREGRGELQADADWTKLITIDDIRGDLHMHTTASDGQNTIEEMALAAKGRGYEYIAITDHSRSSAVAGGLSVDQLERHLEDIRKIDAKIRGIKVLSGTECDILPDGSLDYPDSLLMKCDCVIASIHSAMGSGGKGKLSATERTIKAIENPHVSIIGHPTGRLLGVRPPMEMDMSAVIEAAAANDTILEVNAGWQRLDLKDLHIRQAIDAGVTLAISSDTHSVEGFDQMKYGVRTARRGGAAKKNVVNCLPVAALPERFSSGGAM